MNQPIATVRPLTPQVAVPPPPASNAKHVDTTSYERILLVGPGGGGKTSQLLTLPGRKFAYLTDQNALPTLKGHDIEFVEYLPDIQEQDLAVKTLKKIEDTSAHDRSPVKTEAITYERLVKDLYARMDSICDNYDWLIFDGLTTIMELYLARTLSKNGRLGKQPEQADWAGTANGVVNFFNAICRQPVNLAVVAHTEFQQDDQTQAFMNRIIVTGRARTRLPLGFNHILTCTAANTPTEVKFEMQTRSDPRNPYVRTTMRQAAFKEDVTIKDWTKPGEFGLGALLRKHGLMRTLKPPVVGN